MNILFMEESIVLSVGRVRRVRRVRCLVVTTYEHTVAQSSEANFTVVF